MKKHKLMNMIKILLLLSLVLAPPGKPPRAVAGGGVNPKLCMKRILVACRHDGMDNH